MTITCEVSENEPKKVQTPDPTPEERQRFAQQFTRSICAHKQSIGAIGPYGVGDYCISTYVGQYVPTIPMVDRNPCMFVVGLWAYGGDGAFSATTAHSASPPCLPVSSCTRTRIGTRPA